MRAAVTSSQNASRIKKLAFEQALMRLEFRVPPATDLALVKKLVKDIGKEIAVDPELGLQFIEPLKSQDVRRVEDNAIIIGIKYIAKPDGVWLIRREAYQRLCFRPSGRTASSSSATAWWSWSRVPRPPAPPPWVPPLRSSRTGSRPRPRPGEGR